jgi:hypothetical protein
VSPAKDSSARRGVRPTRHLGSQVIPGCAPSVQARPLSSFAGSGTVAGCYGCWLQGVDVEGRLRGGAGKPPSMPACNRGIRIASRNRSHCSVESKMATIWCAASRTRSAPTTTGWRPSSLVQCRGSGRRSRRSALVRGRLGGRIRDDPERPYRRSISRSHQEMGRPVIHLNGRNA